MIPNSSEMTTDTGFAALSYIQRSTEINQVKKGLFHG